MRTSDVYRIRYVPMAEITDEEKMVSQTWCLQWCRKFTRLKLLTVLVLTALVLCVTAAYLTESPLVVLTDHKPKQSNQAHAEETEKEFNDRIRYKHTKRRLPQVIIIGARKAGTRALLTFLNLHPQIQASKNEVHFFDKDRNYELGTEWYRKKMPYSFPDQITLEKTPAYFVSEVTPQRVHAMNSSIKLLVILRDPVERAISDFLQLQEKKQNLNRPDAHLTFEEQAIDSDTGEVAALYNPLKRSLYYRYVKKWLEYFPLEQFLFISAEQLVKSPMVALKDVETFLNLEHRITEDNFYYNESRGFYCYRSSTENQCLAASKGRVHPKVEPLVLQKLRSYFRNPNHRLYRTIGKDFGWP